MVVCRARLQICLTKIFGGHLLEEHTSDWAHTLALRNGVCEGVNDAMACDCSVPRYAPFLAKGRDSHKAYVTPLAYT